METLQQVGVAVLLVFNVYMWTLVYKERMDKLVRAMRHDTKRHLEVLYFNATKEHYMLQAKHVARITHKKLVLA